MATTIKRIVVYYEDGTYQEVTPGFHLTQSEKNKEPSYPSPVTPYQPWTTPYQPWTVTCNTTGENLNWKMTSTENAPLDYKYTITSTGNGNVEISK